MRQIVQDIRTGTVEVADVPAPRPAAKTVLVRTTWSLISPGTEQAVTETASKGWIGKARDRPDDVRRVVEKARADGVGAAVSAVRARLDDLMTPGYSSAGIVVELGMGVEGLEVGQHVACVGRNAAVHAELAVVPAALAVPIPAGLDDRYAAFAAVGAVAAHGIKLARFDAGSVVAVIGLGLVGQIAAQLATAAGARVVAHDPSDDRAHLAQRHGAVAATSTAEAFAAAVSGASGGYGADAVVIAAATSSDEPIRIGADVARDRATVCVVGDVPLPVPRRVFYDKELQLVVSRSYGPGRYDPEYEREGRDYPIGHVRWTQRRLIRYFLEEVECGRVRLGDLVTHEFGIENGSAAYAALRDPGRLAILIRYPPDRPPEPARTVSLPAPPAPRGNGSPRVALVGPGVFARATLLPLLRKRGADLIAVSGTTPGRAYGVARKWNAARVTSDADELVTADDVDVVVIATRHDSHAPLAAAALAAGKAVFLEKPLAIDEDGLVSLLQLLDDGGRLVVDFNRRFSAPARSVLEHFADRSDPLALTYRINAGVVPADNWIRDPSIGGGRLVGEGCHFVDLCSAVVGARLATIAARPLGTGASTLPGDSFVLTLGYVDGSVATITYAAAGSRALPKERLEVLGAGRAAVIDDFRTVQLFTQGRRGRRRSVRDKGHAAALDAAFRFFSEGGEPPIAYDSLVETTRATFLARDGLVHAPGEPRAVALSGG